MRAAGFRVLLGLLLAWSSASPVRALPSSWILLPIPAIVDTNLTAGYDCQPTYTAAPCAGNGDCYLLLDSDSAASDPFLQSATVPPIPVNLSTLAHIHGNIALPAAVCLCYDGYTGRGDYVDHDANDGDSCAVYQPIINSLAASGCALFSLLILLALVRLRGWYVWHRSTVLAAAALTAHPPSPKSPPLKLDALLSPSASHASPAALVTSPISSQAQQTDAVRSQSRASTLISTHVDLESRRRTRLVRHLKHESFIYPSLALALSIGSLTYCVLRLTTSLSIGNSYAMSAVIYLQHIPYIAASCLGMAGTVQLATSVAKLKSGVDIAVVKKCLLGLCAYQFVAWLALFFLLHHFGGHQQLVVQLFLLLCLCPDFLLGPITVLAVRRINRALLTNLDSLSAMQQQQRRLAHQKVMRMAASVAILTLGNSVVCLWLTADSQSRQTGLPYYAFVWHYSVFVLIGVRLAEVQPPRPISAVCPLPARVGGGGGGIAAGEVKSSDSSRGGTSSSSRPNSSAQLKSERIAALRMIPGNQPPHGSLRLPKLVVVTASSRSVESAAGVQSSELLPVQQASPAESVPSGG